MKKQFLDQIAKRVEARVFNAQRVLGSVQLGMRLEFEAIVDFDYQRIYAHRRELLGDRPLEERQSLAAR